MGCGASNNTQTTIASPGPSNKDNKSILHENTTDETEDDSAPLLGNTKVQLETPKQTTTTPQSPRIKARSKFAGNPDEFELFINDTWDRAMETLDVQKGQQNPNKNLVVRRSGWKTIRIFVSSTFRDFHPEREVLVKKVR